MQVSGGQLGRNMKDFKEFEKLINSGDELDKFNAMFDEKVEQILDNPDEDVSDNTAAIVASLIVSRNYSLYILRKYHEWLEG